MVSDRKPYAERFIHAGIYEARPDVHAVIHNHSHDVIPFGVTRVPLRPLFHVGAMGQGEVEYLTAEEVRLAGAANLSSLAVERLWECWCRRVTLPTE